MVVVPEARSREGVSSPLQAIARQRSRIALTLLVGILVLGTVLRLDNLTTKSFAQVETYVPGIHYPSGAVSDIETRLSIRDTVIGVILHDQDPNPVGYYLLMLGWTRIFGSSILAVRLPSVLFGVGAIILTYYLGEFEQDVWTGFLASGFVALNGYLIYWSQVAKMYSLGCFLGLLASIFLILAYRDSKQRRLYEWLYVGATLAGLVTVVYFWLMFATHVLWTLGKAVIGKSTIPRLLHVQLFTLILGSPLFALAMYQAKRASYLDTNPTPTLVQFFQFGFLFVPDNFAIPPRSLPGLAGAAVLSLAALILGCGLIGAKKVTVAQEVGERSFHWLSLAVAAVGAFLVILRLAKFTYGGDPDRTKVVVACGVLVLLVPAVDLLLRRYWLILHHRAAFLGATPLLRSTPVSLSATVAIGPAVVLSLSSPFLPLFAPRTALMFTPYLLVTVAVGLVYLVHRNRTWLGLLLVLVLILSYSVVYHKNSVYEQPVDFKTLGERWSPEIQESDLIFLQRHYAITPIFIYLQGSGYHFVVSDFAGEAQRHPNARIWVLSLAGLPPSPAIKNALAGDEPQETLQARRIETVLYIRGTGSSDARAPATAAP